MGNTRSESSRIYRNTRATSRSHVIVKAYNLVCVHIASFVYCCIFNYLNYRYHVIGILLTWNGAKLCCFLEFAVVVLASLFYEHHPKHRYDSSQSSI